MCVLFNWVVKRSLVFFLPGLHFVSEENRDKIWKDECNKAKQEHFGQKNTRERQIEKHMQKFSLF